MLEKILGDFHETDRFECTSAQAGDDGRWCIVGVFAKDLESPQGVAASGCVGGSLQDGMRRRRRAIVRQHVHRTQISGNRLDRLRFIFGQPLPGMVHLFAQRFALIGLVALFPDEAVEAPQRADALHEIGLSKKSRSYMPDPRLWSTRHAWRGVPT